MKRPEEFTTEDFIDSTEPYEYVYQFANDPFREEREAARVSEIARSRKVRNFMKIYKEYKLAAKRGKSLVTTDFTTQFEGQELELSCGSWIADEGGIVKKAENGSEICACPHPILPIMRLVNIDSGVEKLMLAFRKGRQWRSTVMDKRTLAGRQSILELANVGVAVTSETAANLINYLYDIETANYDRIPEHNSVSRLGWMGVEGFSPYVDDLIFDGEQNFKSFFESVGPAGREEKWLELAKESRKGPSPVRIILAASFASVLVSKIEALSFFVHLWGSVSGTGKTVALMFAASVWASPEAGKYIHTFHGTQVSLELSAGFVNHLPLILDEFQMIKNKKDFEQIVYMLSEGIGKGRGSKTGGVQRSQTWKNCILTSGEMPITNFMTGAGAFNRIVEVECTEKLFRDPMSALAVIRENYGHAGKRFVEALQEDGAIEYAKEVYNAFYRQIIRSEATEKQAMAGALILTADKLATKWIFQDGAALSLEEIAPYLQTKIEVDIGQRAYDYICDTVSANANRFSSIDQAGEIWGKLAGNEAYIIRSVFERICEEGGFSSRATLSWMTRNKIIRQSYNSRRNRNEPTVASKLPGVSGAVRCVVMRLPEPEPDKDCLMIEDV